MNNERDKSNNQEKGFSAERLKAEAAEHQERLKNNMENREKSPKEKESSVDDARKEALERAAAHEKEMKKEARAEKAPEKRGVITKKERKESYDATMREVRSQMSGSSRAFSNVIHNPVIEKASEVVGSTVARPNAILAGSMFAFLFTLAIYLVAHFNGYGLSGTETIASFALGWIVGLIVDYVRMLVRGGR